MDKFIRWGASFSINMMCKGNKGVLSIPIYSYIDNTQKIEIHKITISDYNNIDLHFSTKPSSKPQTISIFNVVNADNREQDGYRENYNERYD